jgi:two-component system, OmpR family, sensor kinase
MWNSIRFRLTVWYLFVFGLLLTVFSVYIYSQLSLDLRTQFDMSLSRTAQTTANNFSEWTERKDIVGGAEDTVMELRLDNVGAAIFRGSELLAANNSEVTDAIASTAILSHLTSSGQPVVFATDRGKQKRLVARSFQVKGTDFSIVMMEPLGELILQLGRIRRIILFGLPAALVMVAVGGFILAKKTLQPVMTISRHAERISVKNLDERLTIPNPKDELGQLARVFNALLLRLDTSFRVMREFIADASHELRTPLAIIRAEAGVSLEQDRCVSEYIQSLGIIRDQSQRMTRIVSDMLALARADAGQQRLQLQELYLNDIIEECCHAAQTLATIKGVHLTCDACGDISFRGDEELLKRMAVNLLDNAIHYTPTGGSVSVRLETDTSSVRLIVSDTGIGIAPENASRVFDRFYRGDSSNINNGSGSGLGLSIVKLAAEAHGGHVELSSQPGSGSTFIVSLPLLSAVYPQSDGSNVTNSRCPA